MSIEIEQFKGTIYENGYGTVAKAVMKNKKISIGSKALYAYLCSYAWGKNESYPISEQIHDEILSLPISGVQSLEDTMKIVQVINDFN